MGRALLLLFALVWAGCSFDAPAGNPRDLPVGGRCNADLQCQSAMCSGSGATAGSCVECRADHPCGGASTCTDGRCVAIGPSAPRHQGTIGGTRSENGTHVHVGRVAVTPITTEVAR
ncbi:MAG: hypothetical protein U1E65_10910 [Myxococcota bacterium]